MHLVPAQTITTVSIGTWKKLSETKSYYLNIVISGIFPYSTGEFTTCLKGEMPHLFDDKALFDVDNVLSGEFGDLKKTSLLILKPDLKEKLQTGESPMQQPERLERNLTRTNSLTLG